jgi:hypothetical protein
MDELTALVGQSLDAAAVRAFFLTQPATQKRRKAGRVDLSGIRDLSSKADGYEVIHRRGRIVTIFLYLTERDGYHPFRGALTQGLRAPDSRAAVRRRLGPPTRRGAVGEKQEWHWDRYDSEKVCMHFSYGPRARGIRMVTLMAPDVAP